MAECFFSPFNNVNLDHHELLLQSTWNLPCVLGQSRRYTCRGQRCFFLSISDSLPLSSGASPSERGGRQPVPEVLTAETQPVPARPLRGDGLLMGPTPHACGGRVRGERGSGAVSTHTHTHQGQLPSFICLEESLRHSHLCSF